MDACISLRVLSQVSPVASISRAQHAELTFRKSKLNVFDEFSSCSLYTPTNPSACSYLSDKQSANLSLEPVIREMGEWELTYKALFSEMMRNWTPLLAWVVMYRASLDTLVGSRAASTCASRSATALAGN